MAEAQSTNEETLTENLAFAEVLAWSATRPAWQRDALRRLVQSGILGSEEIDELLEICLDPALPHTPLSDADVSSQCQTAFKTDPRSASNIDPSSLCSRTGGEARSGQLAQRVAA